MPRFPAIVLRLLLVFALVANGIGVSAYAMHVQGGAAELDAMADTDMPCHGGAGSGMDQPDAVGQGAAHDCCGKTCACDFAAAAALAPVAWRVVSAPARVDRDAFDAGLPASARASLPLRPPIA
ncbi:CopL family metal-binding regulatory protein [Dokdonella sp.]|uniref:CopL family metal-binding regulatory protein n=1 Tax=Dokdonella sp. TaxID=2291710 RepID=UPI0025C3D8CA|nr:CopL family metal-binding regulatory protein [Dokdonella sp.]MBX3692574.1 CopL family metal-binding regulatory protein [Dokdonella sp.]MCW5568406.1 CopL family metal-binding regulatory protein [Dokdonella sp.]